MAGEDERRPGAPGRGGADGRGGDRAARGAPSAEERERTKPASTPDEAPELLGEESDYPIAWEPSGDGDGS